MTDRFKGLELPKKPEIQRIRYSVNFPEDVGPFPRPDTVKDLKMCLQDIPDDARLDCVILNDSKRAIMMNFVYIKKE